MRRRHGVSDAQEGLPAQYVKAQHRMKCEDEVAGVPRADGERQRPQHALQPAEVGAALDEERPHPEVEGGGQAVADELYDFERRHKNAGGGKGNLTTARPRLLMRRSEAITHPLITRCGS